MKDIHATLIIDLKGKTEEELFRATEYTRRKNVKKAIRSGLILSETDSEKDYQECHKLYIKTLCKGGTTGHRYCAWREWAREEKWKLFSIKKGGAKIGYFSIIPLTKRFYGLDSNKRGIRPRVFATKNEYSQYRVNDFIYWNLILYAFKKGCDFVDLGGYQINPRGHLKEVNKFKERWGGKIFYFYLDFPIHIAIARKLIRKFYFLWRINEELKKFGILKNRIFLPQKKKSKKGETL